MSQTKKKSRPLTIKQTKFVKAYVANDGVGYKAALETYDTTDMNVANNIAVENLQKPTVRDAIDAALNRNKITVDAAVQPIADGLQATREIFGGEGKDVYSLPDHSIRLRASQMALKLLGADANDDKPNGIVNFGTVNFVAGGDSKS